MWIDVKDKRATHKQTLWLSIVLQYIILLFSRNMSKNPTVVPIVVITGAICAAIYYSVTPDDVEVKSLIMVNT